MLRKLIFSIALILCSLSIMAQTVNINEYGGWLETAYVEWEPITEASSYNVYYTGEGISNVQIDTQLIRCYNDGSYRTDILGLKAGSYTISVVPVINGSEGIASITPSISVQAHDRAGFAFSGGRIAGSYNLDGTTQSGAIILYVTEETKDTIELNVIGANSNPCIGLQEILDGFKKGNDSRL
ncbi:pectate lyase [Flaviramulus basaltis]|uniref:Pectate lyase n=1 Tax=Flaviramulus basaltis TaxID=369401 RepID=A0A1K2IJX0_9FLAO|nr:hypothetical protein [Flaviramulus basaltis]SFZ92749.1 pectate lyase [Flaviramulus basaltis]